MGDKWRHVGTGENIGGMILNLFTFGLLGSKECVQNTETGEYRKVYRAHGQSVGEAIEQGQFVDNDRKKDKGSGDRSGGGGGGGGGGGASISFPGLENLLGYLIIGLLLIFGLVKGCEYLVLQTDRTFNKIYPAYETREEKFLESTQKWEQWKHFTQSSDKWLTTSGTAPAMPAGKIVFLSQADGNQRIYQMNLQNKRQTRLPMRFIGEITAYTISLDGDEVAFVSGQTDKNSEIYRIDSIGRVVRLTEITDGYRYKDLAWLSPSVILATKQTHPYVRTIWQVKLSSTPGAPAVVVLRIPTYEEYNNKWVNEANRTAKRTFYSCENPSVSPDGTRLAYIKTEYSSFGHMISAVKGAGKIVVRDLQNNKESIYSNINAVRLTPQGWSPDGSKIAFSAVDRNGKNRIGILELNNPWWALFKDKVSWLRVVGNNPAWSPDGSWIAFDNEGEIYIFDIATGEAKTVPNSIGFLTGSEVRVIDGNIGRVAKGEKPLWSRN